MRNIFETLKRNDVGDMGIGAMIVFIAMVLVAGIAASVLVQTANRLEIQAMTTGEQTTAEVATGIKVLDIEGYKNLLNMAYNKTTPALHWDTARDGSNATFKSWHNYTRIHKLALAIGPRAGSKDVDIAQVIIEISNSTTKCILTYNSAEYEHMVGNSGIFSTPVFDLGANEFGLIEFEDADNSCSGSTPVINRGDKVTLTVNLSANFWGLAERTDIWGMVIPEDGASGIFAFRTPASYTDAVYDLY